MEGIAPETVSSPPSLLEDCESLGGTPCDLLCPDTPYSKSPPHTKKQSVDQGLRLIFDDIGKVQCQESGEVFCPLPNPSSVGTGHSFSPVSSMLDSGSAIRPSLCAEDSTMDQRPGLVQVSIGRNNQLLGRDENDALHCASEKLCLFQQPSTCGPEKYAKGTSSSGADTSIDVDVGGTCSDLNKPDSPAAEQPWSKDNIDSPIADETITNEDSAGPSEPLSDPRNPRRPNCKPKKKRNASGTGLQRKKAKLGLNEHLPEFVGCEIPAQEIYRRFAGNCKSDDSPAILTNLYFSIACQEAFVQLKKAIPQLRKSMKISFSAKTVFSNLQSLDQVASNLTAGRIIQRHLLVELVDHRNQLVEKYKPERYRRAKMIKEDKRRLERPDGLALDEMIKKAYPTMIKDSDEYNKLRTTLRNNLSSGRNPHTLAQEIGRHILDLILVAEGPGKSGVTDNQ
ncbi:hypothetical protein BO71DRAFT_476791 [Aspergillus ellipticus CBS 707.79]|uniref:Uncharacterized protein n=1 Tax=Aspergillus ellipticus CBS 707.79 TaxID=1448320 RepID=A0A319DYE5_9EURO|nr:hypothetical protein BO71DRAFT_476791 [Aspergillus ellipticus CBS 707.79]